MNSFRLVLVLVPIAWCFAPNPAAAQGNSPESIIFYNGQIITMEARQPVAEAIAITGDSITSVGNDTQILGQVRPPGTRLVDLEGRTLMPGFVDPHNHIYHGVFLGDSPEYFTTYEEAEAALLEVGTTTMGDANVWPSFFDDLLPFVTSDRLRVRTSVYLAYNDFCGEPWAEDWYAQSPPVTDPGAMFRIPGIKIFSDGGACNRGAYSFFRAQGDLYFTDKEKEPWGTEIGWLPWDAIDEASSRMAQVIERIQAQGYQAAIHALGDVAVDATLRAIESALDGGPNTPRHRMEHNRFVRPSQWSEYGRIGAISVNFGPAPACDIADGIGWAFLNQIPIIQSWLQPNRTLIDANPRLPIAWKSDYNRRAEWPLAPIEHLWALVTRDELRDDATVCEAPAWLEAGAVTVEDALRMMTINAAYALKMEQKVGSLRPGKFADLIVLSDNPLTVDPESIVDIDVLMTMVGGKVEHCMAGNGAICPGGTERQAFPSP